MPGFDVEAFVTKLDRMGMKLTAVPLADGKLRINRWRMLNAREHTQQIHELWTTQIGDDQERMDVLAAHLDKAAPRAAGCGTSLNWRRIDSQSTMVPDVATAPYMAPAPRGAAAFQFAAPPEKPPKQTSTQVATKAALQPAAPQRIGEKTVGVSNPTGMPGTQRFQAPQVPGRQSAAMPQTTGPSPMSAGTPTASGGPLPFGLEAATRMPKSENEQAALDRRSAAGPQDTPKDTPGRGGAFALQKLAVTPPSSGLQSAR